jgi:hypothetical protein
MLDTPHSYLTADQPANWAIAARLASVLRRLVSVSEAMERAALSEENTGATTALAPRWPRRKRFLGQFEVDIRRLLSQEPYAHLSRQEITSHALIATSAQPDYARAMRLAWSMLHPGVQGDPADETTWMSPTWEIYERWCFLKVIDCLDAQFPGLQFKPSRKSQQIDRLTFSGTAGDLQFSAYLLPRFPAWDNSGDGDWQSVSGERKPDIVLTIEHPSRSYFIVLDAKYRATRSNVLNAMQSAHVYRDALRWRAQSPDLALLLVPRNDEVPWLNDPEFWRLHLVGTCVVGDQSFLKDLLHWLKAKIDALSST